MSIKILSHAIHFSLATKPKGKICTDDTKKNRN